jgi:small redox-active disulfide protein 2
MIKIQILGPGCIKCRKLAEIAQRAADELGLECEIVKVTNIKEIVAFGVMLPPGLVIDGVVKVSGRVPSLPELKNLLCARA